MSYEVPSQVPRVLRVGDYVGDEDERIYYLVAAGIVDAFGKVIHGEAPLVQGDIKDEAASFDPTHTAIPERN